jgi:hypothetical protein
MVNENSAITSMLEYPAVWGCLSWHIVETIVLLQLFCNLAEMEEWISKSCVWTLDETIPKYNLKVDIYECI